jgi:hypothetical protein
VRSDSANRTGSGDLVQCPQRCRQPIQASTAVAIALLLPMLLGSWSVVVNAKTQGETMAVHVAVNRVLVGYGFDVLEASVSSEGAHRFVVREAQANREFAIEGTATIATSESEEPDAPFALSIEVSLSDESGQFEVILSQRSSVSTDGRTYHSFLSASRRESGQPVDHGSLREEQLVSVVAGDTDLASLGDYLAVLPAGESVELAMSSLSCVGDQARTSISDVLMTSQGDGSALAESETTVLGHNSFVAVTVQESRLLCLRDCGVGQSELVGFTTSIRYWGFDLRMWQVVEDTWEYSLAEWNSDTSSQATGSGSRQSAYVLQNVGGNGSLTIRQGNTTEVQGEELRSQVYQEVLLDGLPWATETQVATIDPQGCTSSEYPVHDENGEFLYCVPSGEAMPITAWDFAAIFSIWGGVAHAGVSFSHAVLGTIGKTVAIHSFLEAVSHAPYREPEPPIDPIPCDQAVDIWTCRRDGSMNILRQTYEISWGDADEPEVDRRDLLPTSQEALRLPRYEASPTGRSSTSGSVECSLGHVSATFVSPSEPVLTGSGDVKFIVKVSYEFTGADRGYVGVGLTGDGSSWWPVGCSYGARSCCSHAVTAGKGTLTFEGEISPDYLREKYGSTVYVRLAIGELDGSGCTSEPSCSCVTGISFSIP